MDIIGWLCWFFFCFGYVFDGVEIVLGNVIWKVCFWEVFVGEKLNDCQQMMFNCLLDGFEGKFMLFKWVIIIRILQDIVLCDINDLFV